MTAPYQTGQQCQNCGSAMPSDGWFCPNCRAQVSAGASPYPVAQYPQYPQGQQWAPHGGMAQCHGCGNAVHAHAHSCPHCGAPQGHAGRKSKTTAVLLAVFLGGFGAHKFYLGQIGWGIVYLLFFWTFIPGIAAFVEFILLLVMSEEEFAAKYNHG
jgi:TM2 domain-containing membrane protein YozV/RNA polymerase subunit RPABC4/transcription elongation factor Spt4